jgi:hypothetical protein
MKKMLRSAESIFLHTSEDRIERLAAKVGLSHNQGKETAI